MAFKMHGDFTPRYEERAAIFFDAKGIKYL